MNSLFSAEQHHEHTSAEWLLKWRNPFGERGAAYFEPTFLGKRVSQICVIRRGLNIANWLVARPLVQDT